MPQSTLSIWMNGLRVGTWTQVRGTHRLQYEPGWVQSPAGRALSLSLPFTPGNAAHRGDVVANYFDNLLPDSDTIRSRLRSRFSTSSTGAFDLLTAIGRDCVGAVQLLPEDETPAGFDRIEAAPLTDEGVERQIAASLSGARVLGREEAGDFRISIAGAQEKTALLFHRGKWCRPLGATPTTHILKLPLGLIGHLQVDLQNSVENEWLCLRLMRAFGLPTASGEMVEFGARRVLAVERFDRASQPAGWIARLPQEDFCQALGLPGSKKYESDGGPGMREILRVLDTSVRATEDKRAFVKAQIVFWLLAATDGHAKNFSIFHERGGTCRLTPFYDVLSAWPIIGRGPNHLDWHKARLAMAVRSKNAHWKLGEIKARHWDAVARAAGLGSAGPLLQEIATQMPRAIESVNRQIPPKFPAAVHDKIFTGLQRTAAQLSGGL
ncbi:MAG: type II toxin-antitoxin system HipA family toxin [Verrucomicrobia bacterium]|nr:type II toxin-antitoxin system HipA family toxin [Verrucomicrobiota bacterium]